MMLHSFDAPVQLHLIAAANRQPDWVARGYAEYAHRLQGRCRLELREIPLGRRGKRLPASVALAQEARKMLAAVPGGARVVALDEHGDQWDTPALAARFEAWQALGVPVCFLVGGPDGLASNCLERADERWALSRLTLPHGLVRIVVAEALYRAWTVLTNHPYHRA